MSCAQSGDRWIIRETGPQDTAFRNLLTAVTDGVLFATDSADSIAFGLNAATGTVEWTYPSAG